MIPEPMIPEQFPFPPNPPCPPRAPPPSPAPPSFPPPPPPPNQRASSPSSCPPPLHRRRHPFRPLCLRRRTRSAADRPSEGRWRRRRPWPVQCRRPWRGRFCRRRRRRYLLWAMLWAMLWVGWAIVVMVGLVGGVCRGWGARGV